ncbi:histone acetyltransferase [Streptococcus suis]|nr:histone acetyltransferase [Streptococcus suis]
MTVAEVDKVFVAPNVRSLADAWLYRENGSGKELDKF